VAIDGVAADRYDVVISDVYGGARVPGRLASAEFAAAVARALRNGGIYAANLADSAPLAFARGQVATLRSVFPDVCMMAEPGVLRGRRFGNVVLVASTSPGRLPMADLAQAAARDPFPARLVHGADLERFAAGAKPVIDATAVDSPAPPASMFT
jgi:spermidine synthase